MGFNVVSFDNCGSLNRGLAFEGMLKYKLGDLEVEDQVRCPPHLFFLSSGLSTSQRVLLAHCRTDSHPQVCLVLQVDGLQFLAQSGRYGVTLDRVAVYGHSYGGYMALMALAKRPDIFQLSLAAAPVTFWEAYDTAYTERY
jgi:dipeptidyl-peptidase 9